jgi:hypothetical protein
MYLNGYVPKLQYEMGVVGFFRNHQGYAFASSALMEPITKRFIASIEAFVRERGVPLIPFENGPAQGRRGGDFTGPASPLTKAFYS